MRDKLEALRAKKDYVFTCGCYCSGLGRRFADELFAYIEQEKATPAIPNGYEIATDPATCSHAMLASGEVVEATAENMVAIRLPSSGTIYLSQEDVAILGIVLLREKPKPEPRVWEAEGVAKAGPTVTFEVKGAFDFLPKVRYRIEEVLPE